MKILISGGTGFIGKALVHHLAGNGHHCIVLSRDPARAACSDWPTGTTFAAWDALPACEAVVHLSGSSPVGLWTPWKKRAILQSRLSTTRRLTEHLRRNPPRVFASASAVGFYGHRPGEKLDETATPDPARSFRSRVCLAWEEAANLATDCCRVVNLRIGNVMHPSGGYLGAMLPMHRVGASLVFGDAAQKQSWISRSDAVRLIAHCLENETLRGPVNITSPHPVTQADFSHGLAALHGRRPLARIPRSLLKLALGEFSEAMLDDQHIIPARAETAGFRFEHPSWQVFLPKLRK